MSERSVRFAIGLIVITLAVAAFQGLVSSTGAAAAPEAPPSTAAL